MSELFDWLIHIPEYVSGFGDWLINPIAPDIGFDWTPLAVVGVSAVSAITALVVWKLIRLIIGG